MGRVCLSIIMLAVLLVSAAFAETPELKEPVVTVYVNNKSGEHIFASSGFVVGRDGLVAVSCSIVSKWFEEIENTIVIEAGETVIPMVKIMSESCGNNFAVIKVRAGDLPFVTLSREYKPKRGESVSIMTNSPLSGTAASAAKISSVREKTDVFSLSGQVPQKADGSPVFNSKGETIGILILPKGKRQDQNFVVPSKIISREVGKYSERTGEATMVAPKPEPAAPAPPEKPRPDTAEQALLRALSYERSGSYREALEAYSKAVEMKPDFAEAYVNLGLLNYKLGKYREAAEAYINAIKVKPGVLSLYNKLGAVYILLDEYPKAIEAFKESIKIDPDNSEAHFNLGVAYVITGDKNGAVEEYTVLKKLDTKMAEKLLDLIY